METPKLQLLKIQFDDILETEAELKKAKAEVMEQIKEEIDEAIAEVRRMTGKEYGVCDMVKDGIKVKHTISPKVTWDQSLLADVYKRIEGAGDDPSLYMGVSFAVSETKYKKYTPEIQAVFAPARTVTTGSVKIELI